MMTSLERRLTALGTLLLLNLMLSPEALCAAIERRAVIDI